MKILIVFVFSLLNIAFCEVSWVRGVGVESQYEACSRMRYSPTSINENIPWSLDIFNSIVVQFQLTVLSPLMGCCVSGMWCDNSTCFSQSFSSSFNNYGGLSEFPHFRPVYSCINTYNATKYIFPKITSVGLENITLPNNNGVGKIGGVKLTVSGTHFGADSAALGISISNGVNPIRY